MAKGITDRQHYTDIATALRIKNGEETTYKPSEMAAAILEVECGNKIVEVNIYDSIGMFLILTDGGAVATGSVTFDENGNPTSLTDDNGNTVNFTAGYPTTATDSKGNSVPIIWG